MKMSTDRRSFLFKSCSCLGLLPTMDLIASSAQSGDQETAMADWTNQHLGQGYWSADSLLLSAAKYLEKPEEIVSVAVGFGGGMLQKDLCGFLTGGIMAVGLFADATRGSDKASRDKCHLLTKEYFDWWANNYPLHCSEIGSPCDYRTMGSKASEFLQGMFERESNG